MARPGAKWSARPGTGASVRKNAGADAGVPPSRLPSQRPATDYSSMQHPAIAFIGLGSNLSGPAQQINRALETLSSLPQVTLLRHSGLYLSPPMGLPISRTT